MRRQVMRRQEGAVHGRVRMRVKRGGRVRVQRVRRVTVRRTAAHHLIPKLRSSNSNRQNTSRMSMAALQEGAGAHVSSARIVTRVAQRTSVARQVVAGIAQVACVS